ncbi:MAG: twin-arginine translocase TatA/TatE family subunit [Candidatus Thioglobus sp.]|nr:MAG: twin-arginine translocase TatA/TatE family subunit [Candidatus Thioglobus sp.]
MGLGGIGIWQLLIVLVIVLVIFGRKINFKKIGGDLGGAIKGFKKSMKDSEDKKGEIIDAKIVKEEDENK